ncbi:MAG TPA: hypothetical protein VL500_06405 [Candidatus Eisenbacteria bacterium]|jgi:hypothetical protein|nr:hypothetical protein [Candidatus Eisenbacteria bacterium]
MTDITEQRQRDLECDRILSAGHCMAAASIAAAARLPRNHVLDGWFAMNDAAGLITPFAVLLGIIGSMFLLLAAAAQKNRTVGAVMVLCGALLTSATVPFLLHGLRLFFAGASAANAGAVVALVTFGLAAGLASEEFSPTPSHLRRSAGITVFALFMAAIDPAGIFACILTVMAFLFFAFWKQPANA